LFKCNLSWQSILLSIWTPLVNLFSSSKSVHLSRVEFIMNSICPFSWTSILPSTQEALNHTTAGKDEEIKPDRTFFLLGYKFTMDSPLDWAGGGNSMITGIFWVREGSLGSSNLATKSNFPHYLFLLSYILYNISWAHVNHGKYMQSTRHKDQHAFSLSGCSVLENTVPCCL